MIAFLENIVAALAKFRRRLFDGLATFFTKGMVELSEELYEWFVEVVEAIWEYLVRFFVAIGNQIWAFFQLIL